MLGTEPTAQNHIFRFQYRDASVKSSDLNLFVGQQSGLAFNKCYSVGLEQGTYTACKVFNNQVLAPDHGRHVN